MKQPVSEHRDSMVWAAISATIDELTKTGELVVNTAPDYVVAHICRELAAKRLLNASALGFRDGSGA